MKFPFPSDILSDRENKSGSETDEPKRRPEKHQKKQLTRKRPVNSIDNVVDINNYDKFPIPSDLKTIKGEIKNGKKVERTLEFQNQPVNIKRTGRRGGEMITHSFDVSGNGR